MGYAAAVDTPESGRVWWKWMSKNQRRSAYTPDQECPRPEKAENKCVFPFWPAVTSSASSHISAKSLGRVPAFCFLMLASRGQTFRRLTPRYSRSVHQIRDSIPDKRWPGWAVVVGIEVHAQIKSREKLFSSKFELS